MYYPEGIFFCDRTNLTPSDKKLGLALGKVFFETTETTETKETTAKQSIIIMIINFSALSALSALSAVPVVPVVPALALIAKFSFHFLLGGFAHPTKKELSPR